ncbi:MAG: hypothetical protein ACHQ49_05005 [Elusimicrobiota bacterium]
MKKEPLTILALLLIAALGATASAQTGKGFSSGTEGGPEIAAPEGPAAEPAAQADASAPKGCGAECQASYKEYKDLVAGQEWNVPLYKEFLKRFDEVSRGVKVTSDSKDLLVTSMPLADWYSSYKYREGQTSDKKAAWDGVVKMYQVERADFARGRAEAERRHKEFGSTPWADGKPLSKALDETLSKHYGSSVLRQDSSGDKVRLFPGAMAAADLRTIDFIYVYLGPAGRNTLDSSYCKKEKCGPGLAQTVDQQKQAQQHGAKAMGFAFGARKNLGSGPAPEAAGAAAAASPQFSESFLKSAAPAAAAPPAAAPVPALDAKTVALDASKIPGYQWPKGFNLSDRGVPAFSSKPACAPGDPACGLRQAPPQTSWSDSFARSLTASSLFPASAVPYTQKLFGISPAPAAAQLGAGSAAAALPAALPAAQKSTELAAAPKAAPKAKPARVVLQPKVSYPNGSGPVEFGAAPHKHSFALSQFMDNYHASEWPLRFGELAGGGHLVVSREEHQPDSRYLSVYDSAGVRTVRIRIDSAGGYPKTVSWCSDSDCYPDKKAFRILTVNNPERNSKYDDDQFLMTLGWDASFQIAADGGTYTHFHDDPKIVKDTDVRIGLLSGQWQGAMTRK